MENKKACISTLFSILLAGAIITVKFNKGFIGGYEFELLLAVSLFFVVTNTQSISLDKLLLNRKTKQQQKQK
ncbi:MULTISPECIES: hypothetical protein [Bacillus]|uniref:hypothetical protein n=1 Tax=Bacillus TaxID=1386 RepID=UPI001F5B8604|nr:MULTISPECIES: hypothetical protein [Bacillus]WOA60419.1 hypothetical protein RVY74_27145 [Bacillus mycoides]